MQTFLLVLALMLPDSTPVHVYLLKKDLPSLEACHKQIEPAGKSLLHWLQHSPAVIARWQQLGQTPIIVCIPDTSGQNL